MPVYLRKWYYRKLVEIKKEEQKQIDKAKSKSKTPSSSKFKR